MLTELWLSQRYLRTGKKEKIISLTALISMVGIAIGVMVLIVVISVMSGFDRFLEDKMVGSNSHLLLDFYGGNKDYSQVIADLKKIPHILEAAPFIAGQGFIKIGTQVTGVEMRGIDPDLQPKISKIKEYLRQGQMNLNGNEVILGEELASRFGLGINDKISLISPVTLTQTDFLIKGLFNSGMYLYDSGLIMTSLKGGQDFFKIPGSVNGIAINIDDIYRVDSVKAQIYRDLDTSVGYEAKTWVDANRNFLNALKLEKIVMFIVVTMTTVVAAFGIVSTLIMSVMSRVKDIGILRSAGARTKSILGIFVFQGLAIGVTGIILGLLGGITLALSLNRVVDFISGLIKRNLIPQDIYYFNRIPTDINFTDLSLIVGCALIISLLASVYPAYYAARINPSEALRHE